MAMQMPGKGLEPESNGLESDETMAGIRDPRGKVAVGRDAALTNRLYETIEKLVDIGWATGCTRASPKLDGHRCGHTPPEHHAVRDRTIATELDPRGIDRCDEHPGASGSRCGRMRNTGSFVLNIEKTAPMEVLCEFLIIGATKYQGVRVGRVHVSTDARPGGELFLEESASTEHRFHDHGANINVGDLRLNADWNAQPPAQLKDIEL